MIQMIQAVLVLPVPLCKLLYLILQTLLFQPPLLSGLPIDQLFRSLQFTRDLNGLGYLSCRLILLLSNLLISEEQARVMPMATDLPCLDLGDVCFVRTAH